MRQAILSYPASWVGAGLLLLRLSVVTRMADLPALQNLSSQPGTLLLLLLQLLLLLCILLGFHTRKAAGTLLLVVTADLLGQQAGLAMAGDLLAILALTQTGPGAISLDALVFGRRTLVISPGSRSDGG